MTESLSALTSLKRRTTVPDTYPRHRVRFENGTEAAWSEMWILPGRESEMISSEVQDDCIQNGVLGDAVSVNAPEDRIRRNAADIPRGFEL